MKKTTPLKLAFAAVAIATVAFSSVANAGTFAGTYGYGIELQASGASATNVGTTLYALNNGGGPALVPTGSTATFNATSWLSSPETTPLGIATGQTFNLGSFNPGLGDTLVITGFSLLTFRDAAGTPPPTTITATYGNERVTLQGTTPGAWPGGTSLPSNATAVGGANNDRWANGVGTTAGPISINLLSGLAPGTYVLGTYAFVATSDQGNFFVNNGGNNYGASFTVVPEPTTIGLLLGGAGLLAFVRRRRS